MPTRTRKSPPKRTKCTLKSLNHFYMVGTGEVVKADTKNITHVVFKKRTGVRTHALKYEGKFGKAFRFISKDQHEEATRKFGKPRLHKK